MEHLTNRVDADAEVVVTGIESGLNHDRIVVRHVRIGRVREVTDKPRAAVSSHQHPLFQPLELVSPPAPRRRPDGVGVCPSRHSGIWGGESERISATFHASCLATRGPRGGEANPVVVP